MMQTRLLVNDCLSALPDHKTFWHDLSEWFELNFVGGDYPELDRLTSERVEAALTAMGRMPSLLIRNASYFGPLEASKHIPTISLLQDIMTPGPGRMMQEAVMKSSKTTVVNSAYTASHYQGHVTTLIPLPVDFRDFKPGNKMGLQQALSLPDNCILWVGASQGAAGAVKRWELFRQIVRFNPDLSFVAVFKDAMPEYSPPNLRMYVRVSHEELTKIIGACRVGLCTSERETQHLAGIEMGACGLPMVAPGVGCYYDAKELPGHLIANATDPAAYSAAIRHALSQTWDTNTIRAYWQARFDKPIIRAKWESLIKEIESGHV